MRNSGVYDIHSQSRITFGVPYIEQLAIEVERSKKKRVFVICSQSLQNKIKIAESVRENLNDKLVGCFTDMSAHTPRSKVIEAASQARDAEADLLVSIGGGSIIDGAKAVQLALSENVQTEEELTEFAISPRLPNPTKFAGQASIRQIAIPTTLSGAEFANISGVTDMGSQEKEGYLAPEGVPHTVIFDPALSLHTPLRLWLSSAIRSIDHACEGYCSEQSFPFLNEHYLSALRLLSQSLRQTHRDPEDIEARSRSQQGVWMVSAGIGRVQNGASHGLGYILGAMGVPHGETSCVMLPAVLKWNEPYNKDKQNDLAASLSAPINVSASSAVKSLVLDLGLPTRLSDVGISEHEFKEIASAGLNHPTVLGNPKPITKIEDVLEILSLAK